MPVENVSVSVDKVVLKGGHDTPPEKKKKKKKDDDETKIPYSEKDVEGLTYITED